METQEKNEYALMQGKGRAHMYRENEPDWIVYKTFSTLASALEMMNSRTEDDRIVLWNIGQLREGVYVPMYDEAGNECETEPTPAPGDKAYLRSAFQREYTDALRDMARNGRKVLDGRLFDGAALTSADEIAASAVRRQYSSEDEQDLDGAMEEPDCYHGIDYGALHAEIAKIEAEECE